METSLEGQGLQNEINLFGNPRKIHGLGVPNACKTQQEKRSQVSEAELECARACQGKGGLSLIGTASLIWNLHPQLAPNSRLSFLRIESSTSLFDWLLKKHGRILWRSVFSDSARNQALLLTLKEKKKMFLYSFYYQRDTLLSKNLKCRNANRRIWKPPAILIVSDKPCQ